MSLGLSSEVLTLGAPLEGSMASGHVAGRADSWPSASLWDADLWGSGSLQGDFSGDQAWICHLGSLRGDRRQVAVSRQLYD